MYGKSLLIGCGHLAFDKSRQFLLGPSSERFVEVLSEHEGTFLIGAAVL